MLFNNRAYEDVLREEREKVNAEEASEYIAAYRGTLPLRYGCHLIECLTRDIENLADMQVHRPAAPDPKKFDEFTVTKLAELRTRGAQIADVMSGKTPIERPAAIEAMLRASARMKAVPAN